LRFEFEELFLTYCNRSNKQNIKHKKGKINEEIIHSLCCFNYLAFFESNSGQTTDYRCHAFSG
jgi:hypothetical protein